MQLSPVILVPGDGGSQLEAKLNKTEVVHYICAKTSSDYFNIWLNLELLVPYVIDCWIDNVKLTYNNVTRKTENAPGVDVRAPGWGQAEPVEWLDPSHASAGTYFKDVGNALVDIGYVRNVSLRGAPYDFRKAPNENADFFVKLKQLVEDTYVMNNNTNVTLVAHSMGGLMSLHFLQQQTSAWKAKYIRRFITLSSPWAGAVKALKVFAIGDDLGSRVLRESVLRQEQITCPSLSWLLPSPLFWKKDEVLIQTEQFNYTINNLQKFFDDIDYPTGWEMRKDTVQYMMDFTAPDVELHCLYGSNVTTVERLVYKPGTWLDGYPTLVTGDGDGTVNARSLTACEHWKYRYKKHQNPQGKMIKSVPFVNADHMGMLTDKRVLSYLQTVLQYH